MKGVDIQLRDLLLIIIRSIIIAFQISYPSHPSSKYIDTLYTLYCRILLSIDRDVWFHFTSAKPRDGLASFACRSLTSTFLSFSFVFHRPPCALVFFFLFGFLSNSRFPRRTYLLVLPFDLRVVENQSKNKAGKIEQHSICFLFSFSLSSFASSPSFSSSQIFCLKCALATRAGSSSSQNAQRIAS